MKHGDSSNVTYGDLDAWAAFEAVVCDECLDCAGCRGVCRGSFCGCPSCECET